MKYGTNLFDKDDYEKNHNKYFKELREKNSMVSDISGWMNTSSNALSYLNSNDNKLNRYYIDVGENIADKKIIVDLISMWDDTIYNNNEITLCHSITSGLLVILATLKEKGVKTVIFETPAYFATISQAQSLGFEVEKVPSYFHNNFEYTIRHNFIKKKSPCCIIVTQPKMSIGLNQKYEFIKDLYSQLSENDYLIIDEATEQTFPSRLNKLNVKKLKNIIKIRGLMKPAGINGIRLSFICHHESLRRRIQANIENFQGALDYNSLCLGIDIAKNVELYKLLLSTSNQQVINLRLKVEAACLGTFITPSKLENGYVGLLALNFSSINLNYDDQQKKRLLEYCRVHRVPVILGASMKIASHTSYEFVRINYFMTEHSILTGIDILSKFR